MAAAGAYIGFSLLTSEPVNILLYGLEGKRTDTMMVLSLHPKTNNVYVVNFPRDTYFETKGRNGLGQSKLNATFGFREGGGEKGLRKAIESISGITIDYFVEVDYDAVKNVIDLIGGVPVDVPYDMQYDDHRASPPLHIDFKAGPQVIDGDQAIGYLRFRKSNDGTIREGDIQRIARQQDFLKAAVEKSLNWKMPLIAARAVQSVNTDLNVFSISKLAIAMVGARGESVTFQVLPAAKTGRAKDGLSYYFYDPQKTIQLFKEIQADTFIAK